MEEEKRKIQVPPHKQLIMDIDVDENDNIINLF